MRIVIMFPTATEAAGFQHAGVQCEVFGVGLTTTAYQTLKCIQRHQPDWLILAGIAGVFPHAPFRVGDVTLVQSELEADLGFFTPQGFTHLAHLPLEMDFARRHVLDCPYSAQIEGFAPARSISLNAAMAPFIDSSQADIENMEGAAFFHVCREEGVPFLELRSVSNIVQPEDDQWDMDTAVAALHHGLHQLLDQLQRKSVPPIAPAGSAVKQG